MKRITLLSLLLICISYSAHAQTASVEKSVFGVQIGILGIWAHNEIKLSNSIALRSELGLDTGLYFDSDYPSTGYILGASVSLEPRWYYNLNKRVRKSRNILGNSGNFISIKTQYHPDWIIASNMDNTTLISDISIVPTWGIRRQIGAHFNYETGIGIGYIHYFNPNNLYIINEADVALNLHVRLGYRF
ncbi:hypothetical protein [Bizionia myxarmorum]|uniref:Porin family protein n=1 Tax=Bizionia myxarmorum TaxID=291186 RepID=A0A5D0RE41_9FLAO|nr:hypothetical protein [Bizionia myxarmorum]TYB79867.1 hypothetical protein ES674_09005 [Bizionia myxarmorum]